MVVSQDEVKVEVFRKQSSTLWSLETITGMDAVVKLQSVPVEFRLSELYKGILGAQT